jgi:diguanylate cyclase (GGDEF)-like protein
MTTARFRQSLLALTIAWLGIVAFATHLLIRAEIGRHERDFETATQQLSNGLKHKLDTNEAVLAGFVAFLRAVEGNDVESATRYAASATAAYPHIYMLEVARQVPVDQEKQFEAALRREWLANFTLKSFSGITGSPSTPAGAKKDTWPILFLYPALPEVQAIYGVRLETVDYLAYSLALAQRNTKPVVSPMFELYEGGRAYILLQEVERATATNAFAKPSLFGNTMTALLVIRSDALLPGPAAPAVPKTMSFAAQLRSAGRSDNLLFSQEAEPVGWLNTWLLPRFRHEIVIDNVSQPTVLTFEQQLSWPDLLTAEFLIIIGLLACAFVTVPALSLRHLRAVERGARELERSAYLATHDLLTGLPNRFLFMDRFEQAVQQHIRSGNSFALLLLDLDHFKEINDQYGHEVGDTVLVESARRMTGEIRACDTVARHGGDEFVVLLANTLDSADALAVAEKIRHAIAQPLESASCLLRITPSIGVAMYPADGKTLDELRRAADEAMYEAKKNGRNAVSGFRQAAG